MIKQIKIIYTLFGLSILSVILHNTISAYFKIEEPVFFILTFTFFLSFIISIICCTVSYIKKGESKDLWKIGFPEFIHKQAQRFKKGQMISVLLGTWLLWMSFI